MTVRRPLVVQQVWRYPVKSLGGERVAASWADAQGLRGDRVWAVQDSDGKLGPGKNTRRFKRMTGLLDLAARYLAEPGQDRIQPPVITGPGGAEYPVVTAAADAFLGQFAGLPAVRVERPLCLAIGGQITGAGTVRVGDRVQTGPLD